MIDFVSLRQQLEASEAVLNKFKEEGEFSLSAGDFAAKVAPALKIEKEAQAIVKAIGSETPLFRFRPRENGSKLVPITITPSVFVLNDRPVVVAPDLTTLEVEFLKHRLGPGGYAIVKVGTVQMKVTMSVTEELRNDIIRLLNDKLPAPTYEEVAGAPPLEVESPVDPQSMVSTIKNYPQRDLPPTSDEVPHLVDLEVVEILEVSRKYQSPRVTVKLNDGTRLVGLICTQPICRCLTGITSGEAPITEAVIGQKFQIVDVEDRRRRTGEVLKAENGEAQRTVIVRNTTAAASFSL